MEAPLVEIDEGFDFKVLIVDDAWVVRWPRHKLSVEEIEQEVDLLPVLAPLLPVEVPRFEYVSREPSPTVSSGATRSSPRIPRAFAPSWTLSMPLTSTASRPGGRTGSGRIAGKPTSSGVSSCPCSISTSAGGARRCSGRSRR
jgi:hypothetical protein